MNPITISRGGKILAHHTTSNPLSSYGQPIWTIEVNDPTPGLATWSQEKGRTVELDIIGAFEGWLLARQAENDVVIGIIWSDGNYFADCLVGDNGFPVRGKIDLKKLPAGVHVQGTVEYSLVGGSRLGNILRIDPELASLVAEKRRVFPCAKCGHEITTRAENPRCPNCHTSHPEQPGPKPSRGRPRKKPVE